MMNNIAYDPCLARTSQNYFLSKSHPRDDPTVNPANSRRGYFNPFPAGDTFGTSPMKIPPNILAHSYGRDKHDLEHDKDTIYSKSAYLIASTLVLFAGYNYRASDTFLIVEWIHVGFWVAILAVAAF